MALNRSKNMKEEGLTATVALAMAFYEQTGLRELIDSKFDIDCRQKLTPGNAVKALIELMMKRGFGFVSKCPKNFGQKAQERMVDLVQSRKMRPSSIRII